MEDSNYCEGLLFRGGINASVGLATAVAREGGPTWRIYFPWRIYGRKFPLLSR